MNTFTLSTILQNPQDTQRSGVISDKLSNEDQFFRNSALTLLQKCYEIGIRILNFDQFLPSFFLGANAQAVCPKELNNFRFLSNFETSIAYCEDRLYAIAHGCCPSPNPNFWIFDVKNISDPKIIHSDYFTTSMRDIDCSQQNIFILDGDGAIRVLDRNNLCFTSSSTTSSTTSLSTSSSSSSISSTSSTSSLSTTSSSSPISSTSSTIPFSSSFINTASTSNSINSVAFSKTFPSLEASSQSGECIPKCTSDAKIGLAVGLGIASGLFVGIILGGTALYAIIRKQQKNNKQNENSFALSNSQFSSPSHDEYGLTPDSVHPSSQTGHSEQYQKTPDSVHPSSQTDHSEQYQATPNFVHPIGVSEDND